MTGSVPDSKQKSAKNHGVGSKTHESSDEGIPEPVEQKITEKDVRDSSGGHEEPDSPGGNQEPDYPWSSDEPGSPGGNEEPNSKKEIKPGCRCRDCTTLQEEARRELIMSRPAMDMINELEALDAVKKELETLRKVVNLRKRQEIDLQQDRYNALFQGNPGTG